MQIQNQLSFKIGCLLLLVTFSSCLKENYDSGRIQPTHNNGNTPQVIEMALTATSTQNFYLAAVNNSINDTVMNFIPIKLATAAPASQDIHVTVVLDNSLIDDYNSNNGTTYEPAPMDLYSFTAAEVVIPKGSNTGFLQIRFKPSDFIGQEYGFGFKITAIKESGYTISGNFNSGVAAITIKNKYDGLYQALGTFTHPNPDFTGDYNKIWTCSTSGATTVSFQLDVTVLFGVIITFTVDEATNKMTPGRIGGTLDPFDPALNYYDPATHTFHYDFGYSGGTRHCVGTATYVGPR